MTWIEVPALRSKNSKVFTDGEKYLSEIHSGTLLHYEQIVDSGEYIAQVDMGFQRVNTPVFDGWRTTNAGWHFALGKDLAAHGNQDGWLGFGGRQGEHWIKFRLARLGYLHGPTRTWKDIGGAPSYDRSKLTSEVIGLDHPDESIQAAQMKATWAGLWSTPGGGSLNIQWLAEGKGIKEEIVLNQAGREWITANRPPNTKPSETYFGFVFQVDVSDIPKAVKQGILQSLEGDFGDEDGPIELRNALDMLLAYLPIDYAWSSGDQTNRIRLLKRFWKDIDGNNYLLIGASVPDLAGLPAGAITFDPTLDVVGSNVDGYVQSGNEANYATARATSSSYDSGSTLLYCGYLNDGIVQIGRSFLRFDTSPLSGYVVDQVNLSLSAGSDQSGVDFDVSIVKYNWSGQDPLSSANREAAYDGILGGTQDADWRNTNGISANTMYASNNLDTTWINTGGNTYYGLLHDGDYNNTGPGASTYQRVFFWSSNYGTAALRPKLSVIYSEAAAGNIKKLNGVAWANVKKFGGVSKENIKQVAEVPAQ